jgi:hypothetical protein
MRSGAVAVEAWSCYKRGRGAIMRALLAALLVAFATPASAECTKASLAGTWNAYLTLTFQQHVGWCKLVIRPNGKLTDQSRCILVNVDEVPTGQLTIGPSCAFNGTIQIGSTDYQIFRADLRGKTASGIGLMQSFSFTMMKD